MNKLRPFFIAIQFLTRIPTPKTEHISEDEIGHSTLFYPLVGLVIGLFLISVAWVTGNNLDNNSNSFLSAAIILTAWVLVTGALHIDGLADSADAWLGGNGDKERTLEIMKDPLSGPVAVTIIILLLLLKLTAIEAIISAGNYSLLLLAPVIARSYIPLLLLTTPYVRNNGLGSTMVEYLPSSKQIYSALGLVIIFSLFWAYSGFTAIIVSIITFFLIRKLMLKRINGTTGDTAGAMLEIMEATILIAIALSF